MYRTVKRMLDFTLALFGGLLLSPLWLTVVCYIRLGSPGPVLFTQRRVGMNKRIFTIYKFRTMRMDAPHDVPTHLLRNPDRYITPIGRFLRRTSLDELPQLINVLKGDMSFIGPRPALWNQYDLIAERDRYVGRYGLTPNGLRPGLSGLAQISGRDELAIPEKARLDGLYAKEFGFPMDCRCFFGTLKSVLKSDGVVEGGAGGGKGDDPCA